MKELKEKLNTLCIFRELLKDSVISSLCAYMENPTSSAYAEFVAVLYNQANGNLGEYIKEICKVMRENTNDKKENFQFSLK